MITHVFSNELRIALPQGNALERLFKWLLLIVGFGAFIALEVYIFMALDSQLESWSSYGTLDFLILFLFLYFFVSTLAALPSAKSTLYRDVDQRIFAPLPVSQDSIILGKGIYLYVRLLINNLLLATPILIAYGASRNPDPSFYVFSVIYPLVISFVSLGLLMALIPIYARLSDFISGKFVLQLILGTCVTIGLCFAYQWVLNLFLYIIQGSRLDSFFSVEFLDSLHGISPWLFPVSSYILLLTGSGAVATHLLTLGASIFVMAFLGLYLLTYLLKFNKEFKSKETKNETDKPVLRVFSPTKALIRKEFVLLFRNGSYLFSFTSLLFMQPFLTYVVVSSLSSLLYSNLAIFMNYFTELDDGISLVIILLFSSIVASGASDGVTREGKGRVFMKTCPISPLKQTLCKILIPLCVSWLSFFVTLCVVLGFGSINATVFFVALVAGTMLILSVSCYGYLGNLASYSMSGKGKGLFEAMPSLLGILFPLIVAGVHFLLMFYTEVSVPVLYLSEVVVSLVLLLPLLFVPLGLRKMYMAMGAGV